MLYNPLSLIYRISVRLRPLRCCIILFQVNSERSHLSLKSDSLNILKFKNQFSETSQPYCSKIISTVHKHFVEGHMKLVCLDSLNRINLAVAFYILTDMGILASDKNVFSMSFLFPFRVVTLEHQQRSPRSTFLEHSERQFLGNSSSTNLNRQNWERIKPKCSKNIIFNESLSHLCMQEIP